MSNRPEIPAKIKRALRQEAFFGCVKCGCPIIEYHHIESWSKVKKHEENNLVALCPNCHREANVGAYYKEKVIEDKYNPFNKKSRYVQHKLMLRKYEDVILKLGGNVFCNTQKILNVFGMDLLYFNIGNKGEALLNATFFDEKMRLIAVIRDNEWRTFLYDDMWDIQYSPGHLKINLKKNKIFLELRAKGSEIVVNTYLYVFGNKIEAKESYLKINNCIIENSGFYNCGTGITIGKDI